MTMANLFVYLLNLSSPLFPEVGDEWWNNKERFVGNLEGPSISESGPLILNLLVQEQFWLAYSHRHRLKPSPHRVYVTHSLVS